MADTLVKFRVRRGTAAQWAAVNPVLSSGEPGFETDTKVLRIGDGVTAFLSLKRFASIDDIDNSVLLTKTGNLAGMSDVGTARANLGALGASDLIGAISMFATSAAPAGWLKANGAAVSRTAYAALFSRIGTIGGVGDGTTTFNLPDLRGLFLRVWDDGRGVDAGRGLGTFQDNMFQDHTHNGVTDAHGGHAHTTIGTTNQLGLGSGVWRNRISEGTNDRNDITVAAGAHTHNVTGYGVNAGWWTAGGETRPRNLALLACIKF